MYARLSASWQTMRRKKSKFEKTITLKSTWKATKQTERGEGRGGETYRKDVGALFMFIRWPAIVLLLSGFGSTHPKHPQENYFICATRMGAFSQSQSQSQNKTHIAHINCTQACHLCYSNSLCHSRVVSSECSWRFGCLDVVAVFRDCCLFF